MATTIEVEVFVPYENGLLANIDAAHKRLIEEAMALAEQGFHGITRGLAIFDDPDFGGIRVRFEARR